MCRQAVVGDSTAGRLTKSLKPRSHFTVEAQYKFVRFQLASNIASSRAPAGLDMASKVFDMHGKPGMRVPDSKTTHSEYRKRVAFATLDTLVDRLNSPNCTAVFLEADSSDQPRIKIQAMLFHGIEWERVDPSGKPAIGDVATTFTVCMPLQQVREANVVIQLN